MNPILLRYAGVALVAVIAGAGGIILIKNGASNPQIERGPDITISDVIINPTFTSVSIYWTTNVPTTGKMEYGPDTSYGQEWGDESTGEFPSAYHRVRTWKVNLPESARDMFHFRIVATDPKTGKGVKSEDHVVNFYKRSADKTECKSVVKVPEDYRHIQVAIAAACINGTVTVSPGTYREEIEMYHGVNVIGTSPSNTKIVSPAAAGPTVTMTIDARTTEGYWPQEGFSKIKPPTISGFTISSDYIDTSPPPPSIFTRGPIALAGSDNVSKANASFPFGSIGILINTWPHYDTALMMRDAMVVKNNIFVHNDTGIVAADYIRTIIEDNTFIGGTRTDYGIMAWLPEDWVLAWGGTPRLVIQNNAVVNYDIAGMRVGCGSPLVDECRSRMFGAQAFLQYNNVRGNKNDYLFETLVYRGGPNMRVSPYAVGAYFSPLWQEVPFLTGKEADQAGKNGNISADPLFVNMNAGDFHELAGSPHVDAGNPASDFSQEPQPNGGRINIGAYGNTPEAVLSQ